MSKTIECHVLFLAPVTAKIPEELRCSLESPKKWKERYGPHFLIYKGLILGGECEYSLTSLKEAVISSIMKMNPAWIQGDCRYKQANYEEWYKEANYQDWCELNKEKK